MNIVEHQGGPLAIHDSLPIVEVIRRAASDPSVDVEKLERLMLMHERVMERNAEAAFNEAMRAS